MSAHHKVGDELLGQLLGMEIGGFEKIGVDTLMRRVPGGWVYETWTDQGGITACFLPWQAYAQSPDSPGGD